MPKAKNNLLGAWAFLIGVILAVIFAFFQGGSTVVWILFIIGLIVGLLNVGDKEVNAFLMAAVVLVIVSSIGRASLDTIPYVESLLTNLSAIFVPATVIVALKTVFAIAKK